MQHFVFYYLNSILYIYYISNYIIYIYCFNIPHSLVFLVLKNIFQGWQVCNNFAQ